MNRIQKTAGDTALGTRPWSFAARTLVAALALLSPSMMLGQPEPPELSVINYSLVSELRLTRSQWFSTYSATLTNTGAARAGVTATVTSLTPSIQVIPGQGVLHFRSVPANGQVVSSDTFTILVDRDAPFDWANLRWSFLNPVAHAGANQTTTVGSTVTLNGGSSSNPSGVGTLTYSWTLAVRPSGSNAVLTGVNSVMPSFVVDVPGNYIATLAVSNGTKSDSAAVTVSTVNSTPVARAGPNQTVAVGNTVGLNGSGSSDVDGDPLTYSWTLISRPAGSNTFIAAYRSVSASINIDKPGTYVAQLVVNDGKVDSAPATVMITSGNTPPVAYAGTSQVSVAGSLVQLSGSGSTDVDGDPLFYIWSLVTVPAGSTAHLSNTNAVNPTFTADLPGTYVAQLTVNDGKVDSSPSTVAITTSSLAAPTANAGLNQTVAQGAVVDLNGSGSDPLGRPLTWSWSLVTKPAGSAAVLSSTSIRNPGFVADKPGNYVAQLIVNNGTLNSAPSTVTISTSNTPPVANAGSNQSVNPGATVSLSGAGSSDADNDLLSYSWSFTSRPSSSTTPLQATNSASPSFVADAAGTYVLQLMVNDGFSNSAPATVTVTAIPLYTLSFTPPSQTLTGTESRNLVLTLSSPAQTAVTLNITSSNPAAATVSPATVTIPVNTTTGMVTVTGVAAGTSVIRASSLATGDTTANVTVTASADIILPANMTVAPGESVPFPVSLASPAAAPLSVQLTSSDPSTAALSATGLNFNAGETQPTRQPTITGVANGIATVTASTNGLAPAYSQVSVGLVVSMSPPTLTLGANGSGILSLTLSGAAPTNITFALTSSNPGVATVPQVARFSTGTRTINFVVTAVSAGSAVIKGSGLGFADVTSTVTVQSPGSMSLSSSSATPVQLGQNGTVTVTLSHPAAVATTINFASSDTTRATVSPSSIVIPQGSTTGSTQVTGKNVGSTTISATAQGYAPASLVVQIGATIAWVEPSATIHGTGQMIIVDLRLFATVPGSNAFSILDGLAINVTSSNPEIAVTPSHVSFYWDGSTVPSLRVQVTSVRPGTTILHASGVNIPDVAMTINVTGLIAVEPSGPVSIGVLSGSAQSTEINTTFAEPLKVVVRDANSNPVSGAAVTFTAPATGASGFFAAGVSTVTTDANGVATSALFNANSTVGTYAVTANVGALSASFTLTNTAATVGVAQLPTPVSVSPASGTGLNQTFTYTFKHPGGVANLSVLNVLINKFLDGRQTCYIAFVPSGPASGTLLLVNDAGEAGGPFAMLSLPGDGSVSNSQCTIGGAGSSVTSTGDTLSLTLATTFSTGFTGDKVIYMAARDTVSNNSGWQALGVWEIPGPPETGPVVVGITPGRTSNAVNQAYTFSFTDSYGFMDLSVLNILVNSFLDGRNACYIAYVPATTTTGTLYLVNDAGEAGGPFQSLSIPGNGFVHNSQCTITGAGSSAYGSGTNLSLTLAMTFTNSFAGNQVIYAAARSNRQTSDWHAKGTVTVLGEPWIGPASIGASFSPQNLTLSHSDVRDLTVTLSAPAPATGITLNFLSTNTNVAQVSPAVLFIPPNSTTTTVQVTAMSSGEAVIRVSAENTIAVNMAPATANITVNDAPVQIILPGPMTIQPGQIADYPVTISAPAGPNGVFVILTSSDPSKVALSPNSDALRIIFFPPGSTLPDRRTPSVYGIAYGSALITATGEGLQSVSQTVQVSSTVSLSPQTVILGGGQSQNLTLTLSGAAPPTGLTFNVSSSNPAIAVVSGPVVSIPANATTGTIRVTGVSGGSVVITASAVGVLGMTAIANVTVNAVAAEVILPGPMTLLPGQVAPFPFRLSAPAGPGGAFITLTSSDPTKVALTPGQGNSIIVFIPEGSTDPDRRPPDVYGINFGSATITATGEGSESFSQTILVTATLSWPQPTFSTFLNGRENRITLNLSAPAPAGGVTVQVSSDNPSVASVPATIFIPAGTATGTVGVTSVGIGSTVVHASAMPHVPDATLSVTITP